jgi:hypothetical protein
MIDIFKRVLPRDVGSAEKIIQPIWSGGLGACATRETVRLVEGEEVQLPCPQPRPHGVRSATGTVGGIACSEAACKGLTKLNSGRPAAAHSEDTRTVTTSPYLDKPLVPLTVALPRMLEEIEAQLATARPAERRRLRERAELIHELLTRRRSPPPP